MIQLTDKERDELEQLLLDVVYNFGRQSVEYNLDVLFDILTKVEEDGR